MDKKRLILLEKAFEAEVRAALHGSQLHMMQTKSKLAETLVEEGRLSRCKVKVSGVTVEGFELTHFGRMEYCMTCDDMPNVTVRGAPLTEL